MLMGEVLCSIYFHVLSLAVIFPAAKAFPYFDPRLQENDWREMMLLSPPPARSQYEPSYGYPDYGDYGEPRPAFSEMDILREQLARSEPPFNKRLPTYENSIPAWEAPPAPIPGTWYDREIPVQNQIQDEDNVQELTEALMEALAQQIEQNRLAEAMIPPVAYDIPVEQVDPVVEELREAAVKKSVLPASTTISSTATSTSASTTTLPPTPKPDSKSSHIFPQTKNGQKEIPLLRPPSNGRNSPNRAFNPVTSTNNNGNNNNNHQKLKKQMRVPRYEARHQFESFVSNEDDLIQELDNLKKKSH